MRRHRACLWLAAALWAVASANGQSTRNPSTVPQVIRFSGTARDAQGNPVSGGAAIRFALYAGPTGGAPLWSETQTVPANANGRYSVLLGAASPGGLPAQLFVAEQAHWIGVSVEGQAEEPRVLLVSAPYAMQAKDAETLAGFPPSAFLLAAPAVSGGGQTETARDVSPQAGCSKITSDGTAAANEVSKFTGACVVEPSAIFEAGGNVGIGTTAPAAALDVKGAATLRGALTMNAKGAATAAAGANSNPLDLLAASFGSTTDTSISQHFRWQAEPAANDTANPSGTLHLLYAQGSGAPVETGVAVSGQGLLTFAAGQTFPGAGSITGLTAGSGLSGGGTTGAITVGMTHACASGQALQWNGSKWACVTLGAGDITGVTAGTGLSGGGTGGNITLANTGVLAVGAGSGITSTGGSAPAVNLNTGFTDGRYLQLSGGTLSGPLGLAANSLTVSGNQLVEEGGNVGMATAAPSAPLEVAGSVQISGAGSGLTFPDGSMQATAGSAAGGLKVNRSQVALLKWFPAYQTGVAYAVGSIPTAIAFDGANLWVANYFGNTVTKLIAATGAVVGTYPVGSRPYGIAFDGANIWVTNLSGNNVTKLLASTGALVGTYGAVSSPIGIAFDGANMWVANSSSGTVTKLLAATGAAVGTYNVGQDPYGVAFDGADIWVANEGGNTVTKLRASDGACVGTCTFSVGASPTGVTFDGTNIWVANQNDDTVTKLLAASGAVLGTYGVGPGPTASGFDGANIWVANSGGNAVTKLAASNGAALGTFNAGNGPIGVAFDGANVWVVNTSSNNVSKL